MSFPAEVSHSPSSVGWEGGGWEETVAALRTPVEWMRFCERCESEQIFVAGWQCAERLMGCCLGCGEESVVRFTRTNSEVA